MTRTGRCILQSHDKYQVPNEDTSVSRTVGLGVCYVLSMYEMANIASGPTHISPAPNLEFNTDFLSNIAAVTNQSTHHTYLLREDELISAFCTKCFSFIPPQDQCDWIQKVQSSLERLDFVSSAASRYPDKLNACLNKVESALLQANLKAKHKLTNTEVIAVQIVQGLLDQLDNTISKVCPEAFATYFRKGITKIQQRCRGFSEAPSDGVDEAWHKRAQSLLDKARIPVQPAVWDQVADVLREAETILETRSFTEEGLDTFIRIVKVAAVYAPVYPCVADCANVWYKLTDPARQPQEEPQDAGTVFHQALSLPVSKTENAEAPLTVDLTKVQGASQGYNTWHYLQSYGHQQVPSPSGSTWQSSHQRSCQLPSGLPALMCKQGQGKSQTTHHDLGAVEVSHLHLFDTEFWTLPPGSQGGCDASAESLSSEKGRKADLGSHESSSTIPSPSTPKSGHGGSASLTLLNRDVNCLVATMDSALGPTGKARKTVGLKNPNDSRKNRIQKVMKSLSKVSKYPPLDAHALASLNDMRSSLMTARARYKSSPVVRMSRRHMAKLNSAIISMSHLRHLARLANMETVTLLGHKKLESLNGVLGIPKEPSSTKWVASTSYAALLTTDSDEEAKAVVDDFVAYSDLASKPIDLTTAKLYLLSFLYLKHEKVNLLEAKAQESLSKLISRLHDDIFREEKTEIQMYDFPEFKEFHLAYFEANTPQRFHWQDSLELNKILARDGLRPIVAKLVQYGNSFCRGLDRLKRVVRFTRLAPHCTNQLTWLEGFRRHLLHIATPERLFADDETLTYLEQFDAFAKICLDECQINGNVTCYEQIQVLEVTLDCLQWCRLLLSYFKVPPPSSLLKTYDMTASALILKRLWSHQETASLLASERAFISQGILSALESNNVDDELLACTKMFLDRSVPSRFVESIFDELLLEKLTRESDHDKMVILLALECRRHLFEAEIASDIGIVRMPTSFEKDFTEALVQARLIAKGVQVSTIPAISSNPSLQQRFVASTPRQAPRQLSVDVVLEEAVGKTNMDHLTVSQVARHVATYLLGDSVDEQWLDFLTCQIKWCSFTPQQLAKRRNELKTFVQSLDTFLKAFCFKFGQARPFDINTEASPSLIRHFVNMATLKWLSDRLMGHKMCSTEKRQLLNKIAGEHVFAWMPKWLALMHGQQALFPSDVFVKADFFEKLCVDVSRQRYYSAPPKALPEAPLDQFDVSAELRHCLKGVGIGTFTKKDLKALMGPHASPVISRWSRNMLLTFLLYVRHHERFPMDMAVIEECIKTVVHEGARYEGDNGLSVSTMQKCIGKLLNM